jgi:polyisoprenoid-binding protein YceI
MRIGGKLSLTSFGLLMRSVISAAALVAVVLLTSPLCSAAPYVFDKRHTEVRFAYSMGLSAGRGRFTRVDGKVDFDEAAPEKTKVIAIIEAASLATGEPIMDSMLKGSEFFDVVRRPQLRFTSRTVHMRGPGKAEMSGEITINGITKPVVLQVTLQPHVRPELKYSRTAYAFTAATQIRRSEFGMTAYSSMAGDDIKIEIDALLNKP